jgi:HK97 family phage major capsid protein
MKNSVELKQERAGFITEANEMLKLCKNETRDFTAEEQVSYDGKMSKIDELKKSIEMIERQEKLNSEIASKVVAPVSNEPKEVRDYSLFKAINDFTNGKLEGVEREMHEEAVTEARSSGRSINGLGVPSFLLEKRAVDQTNSQIAPVAIQGYAEALREASVFDKVGANILTGLSADTRIPITGKQTVSWESEVAATSAGGEDFTKLDLTPYRLSANVGVSKQLLLQNGVAAEQAIIRDLGRAVGNAIDAAMFANADVTSAPPCIFGTSGVIAHTATSFSPKASVMEDMLLMEQALAEGEGLQGNLSYVMNPVFLSQLRQSAQVAAVSAAYGDNTVNGYPVNYTVGATKTVGDKDAVAIFGDFSKLYVGMFNGLDIMADPYTLAHSGQVRLVLNQYMDWGMSNPGAFVKCEIEYAS